MGYTGDKKREYQREWVAKRRATFFADKCCAYCGSTKNLELDHIDPSQKVSHSIWSWSESRRNEELAKCQALCEECHKEKTALFDASRPRKVAPEGMAWCSDFCKSFRPVEMFFRDKNHWNGLSEFCKECYWIRRKGLTTS